MRPKQHERVTHLSHHATQRAHCVQDSPDKVLFYVEDTDAYRPGVAMTYAGHHFAIEDKDAYTIWARPLSRMPEQANLPLEDDLLQWQQELTPQAVSQALHDYWDPYWTRDAPDEPEQGEQWASFDDILENASILRHLTSSRLRSLNGRRLFGTSSHIEPEGLTGGPHQSCKPSPIMPLRT